VSVARVLLTATLAVLALALLACGESGDGEESAGDGDERMPTVAIQTQNGFNAQQIYADAAGGVVTIRSVFGNAGANPLEGSAGQGSGFVLSEDGEIVTNAHVVTNAQAGGNANVRAAEEVFVEFEDRNQVPAEVVGFDPNADTALLQIEPDGLDLEPLQLGDSDRIDVGAPVAAIGSPFGQEQSISTGIVSATDRAIESLTEFRIDGAIQTDASINPGNSGGPLIDPSGRVIGINQQINTTSGGNEGVGFAVPVNLVKRSIEDLREDGEAEYAYIGVESVPLYPQLAEELDVDAPTGSLITRVTRGGPAEDAGLRGSNGDTLDFQGRPIPSGGDVIIAIDGNELVNENDLSRFILQHRPGDTIPIEVIRDGDRREIDVTLEVRPEQLGGNNNGEDGGEGEESPLPDLIP
jgi:S1-C subfamily serine protease